MLPLDSPPSYAWCFLHLLSGNTSTTSLREPVHTLEDIFWCFRRGGGSLSLQGSFSKVPPAAEGPGAASGDGARGGDSSFFPGVFLLIRTVQLTSPER